MIADRKKIATFSSKRPRGRGARKVTPLPRLVEGRQMRKANKLARRGTRLLAKGTASGNARQTRRGNRLMRKSKGHLNLATGKTKPRPKFFRRKAKRALRNFSSRPRGRGTPITTLSPKRVK